MVVESLETARTDIGDQFGRHRKRVVFRRSCARNQRSCLFGAERPVRRGNRGQHLLNATVGNNCQPIDTEENVNDMEPQSAFLSAFSLHPAGVAVITGLTPEGSPVGFTATSLASFSAEPPRASFNIAQHASSYPAVGVGSRLLLHVLAENQVDVARIMAGDHDARFTGDHWAPDHRGLPLIHNVRAVLEAHVVAVNPVGSNSSIVVEIDGGDTNTSCAPLVYVERRYHSVGDVTTN